MTHSSEPREVLQRDPLVQLAELDEGRVLIWHRRGLGILTGPGRGDLERVLAEVDGERTAGEVAAALDGVFRAAGVERLLAQLREDVVEAVEDDGEVSSEEAPRVLVVGSGTLARRLAGELKGAKATGIEGLEARLEGAALVICALEEVALASLFELQRRLLAARVPSLFVVAGPDGVHLGPLTVGGLSPCLACARLAGLGGLGSTVPELLRALAELTAGGIGDPGSVAREVVSEARAFLGGDGEPRTLTGTLRLLGGKTYLQALARREGCPLCASATPPAGERSARVERWLAEALERRPRRAVAVSEAPGEAVRTVGILGGGTAGYLTALALRKHRPEVEVTVIESKAVPVIGVGEATTPLMPQFLHVDLGLDVHQLFREVRPTFKLGIRFEWGEPGEGSYFNYPFGKVDVLEPFVYEGDVRACSLRSQLMSAGVLPLFDEGGRSLAVGLDTRSAYHLDNRRFVAYLERRAGERGVRHLEATVADVEVGAAAGQGAAEVRALVADDGRRLAFDLYVDCSGFRSLLLEKALGSPFVSYAASLFTDAAVVATVPHGGRVAPYTTAETRSAGWCWSTPQADADHRGYVFSTAFQGPEAAAEEMRAAYPGMGEHRLVPFRAGRHRHFWRGNVVAMGNAYGFVEPLESTALHMLIRQIGLFVRAFPERRGERCAADLLDRKVGAFWDYLAWFLALHYRFNRRLETPFWRACHEEVDVARHGELLASFRERGPLSYDPLGAGFDYPDPLWGAEGIDLLLLGQKVPARLPRPRTCPTLWRERRRLARSVVDRAIDQRRALELLDQRPELLERFAETFRAAGAAFS